MNWAFKYNSLNIIIFLAAAAIFNIIMIGVLYHSRILHLLHKSYDKQYGNDLNRLSSHFKKSIYLSFTGMIIFMNDTSLVLMIILLPFIIINVFANTLLAFNFFIKLWLIPRNE